MSTNDREILLIRFTGVIIQPLASLSGWTKKKNITVPPLMTTQIVAYPTQKMAQMKTTMVKNYVRKCFFRLSAEKDVKRCWSVQVFFEYLTVDAIEHCE